MRQLGDILITLLNFIFGLAILGLVLRFILRLFGANQSADFVRFIYNSTDSLLDPFRFIFPRVVFDGNNVIEFSTLFAILIYLLIAYLITELIAYITYTASRTYRQ